MHAACSDVLHMLLLPLLQEDIEASSDYDVCDLLHTW